MQADVADEVALLHSLRFTPISPARHATRRSTPAKPRETAAHRRARELQNTLQRLVDAHQEALFDGKGDLSWTRNELHNVVCMLRDTLSETLETQRFEVIKLRAQKEDAEATAARIESLSSSETDGPRFSTTQAELAVVEEQIAQVKLQLDALQKRRSDLKNELRSIHDDRIRRNEDNGRELKRLRALPTAEQLDTSIMELTTSVDKDEAEVVALTDGADLLSKVVEFLRQTESKILAILVTSQTNSPNHSRTSSTSSSPGERDETPSTSTDSDQKQVFDVLLRASKQMDKWLEFASENGWKLLEVVIGSERESIEIARTIGQTPD